MRTKLILIATLTLPGCATKHTGTYEVAAATGPADMASALTEHADTLWELRDDKAKLADALGKYEQAYAADPTSRHVAGRLVRGWYFYGDAYETDKDAKVDAWGKAIHWGARCLAINKDFVSMLDQGDDEATAAEKAAVKDDVPCLYWTSSALGKWGKIQGLAKTLGHIGTVKAYMGKAQELDPTFWHYGPDRYWGAYYAAIPSFAGQDLDKSRTHFDTSIASAPDYLGTKVLLAEYWAVKVQDRAVFDESLKAVLAADPTKLPDAIAENKAEQAKAQALLDNADDLFR